ncbi:hypothetical protein Tco_0099739 [Tanacetum coccineum]
MAKRPTVDLDDEEEQNRTRTKNMLTGKWTRIYSDCQKFNAIYKHLELKSGENEAEHIDIAKTAFMPDVRPRPAGKTQPAKKTTSETKESIGGIASESILDSLSEDLRRKLQAASSAYKAKKEKELAYTKCKEL